MYTTNGSFMVLTNLLGDDQITLTLPHAIRTQIKENLVYIHELVEVMARTCLLKMYVIGWKYTSKKISLDARRIHMKKLNILEWSSWV